MALDPAVLKTLKGFQTKGDGGQAPYYQTLMQAGDPYGDLALGVVRQDRMAGMAACSYAVEVGQRYCRPISASEWLDLSIALMQAAFRARQVAANFENNKPTIAA